MLESLVPRGQVVEVTMWVDTDCASDLMTGCSNTGVIIFVNLALMVWYYKHQDKID